MDFTNVPDNFVLKHMNTLQNMVVQMVRDFPRDATFWQDVAEMKLYIYKWEAEATKRKLEYKGIEERISELKGDE